MRRRYGRLIRLLLLNRRAGRLLARLSGSQRWLYGFFVRLAYPLLPRAVRLWLLVRSMDARRRQLLRKFRRQRKYGPRLTTAEEFAREARASKPLRGWWGFHDAGVFNPSSVKRRYQRHCEYYAISDWRWKSRHLATGALGFALSVFIYITTDAAAEYSLRPRYPLLEASLAFLIGGGIGMLVVEGQYLLHRWNMAYARVYAFENLSEMETLERSPDWYEGRLPMLAFADRVGFILGGPAGAASMNNALIFLILPKGVSPELIKSPYQLHELLALESSYDTVPVRESWSIMAKSLEFGEVLKNLGQDRLKDLLEEGVPWLIIGGGMIIIFFLAAIVSEGVHSACPCWSSCFSSRRLSGSTRGSRAHRRPGRCATRSPSCRPICCS